MYYLEFFTCYKKVINFSLSKFPNHLNLGQQNECCLCTATSGILDGYLFIIIIIYVIFWVSALENRNSRYTTVGNREIQTFQVILAHVQNGTALSCFSMALFRHSRLTDSSADQKTKAVLSRAMCSSAASFL